MRKPAPIDSRHFCTLRSVADGYTSRILDDGEGEDSGRPGPDRARILHMLRKKSPQDGKALFLLVGDPCVPKNDGITIDFEGRIWDEKADERLEAHLVIRRENVEAAAIAKPTKATSDEDTLKIAEIAAAVLDAKEAKKAKKAKKPKEDEEVAS